jgi:hypothetical protein
MPACQDEEGEEGGSDITFRRVLLNKCQEEFEEGDAAMKAVEARERAAAQKVRQSLQSPENPLQTPPPTVCSCDACMGCLCCAHLRSCRSPAL